MCRMHNFLSAKIPYVYLQRVLAYIGIPRANPYSARCVFIGIVVLPDESLDERGLPDATLADDNHFGFVQRKFSSASRNICKIKVDNILRIGIQNLGWDRQRVSLKRQFFEFRESDTER